MSSDDLRVVTILNDAYPELRDEIARISVRSRAERLRFLASYGLACLQGGARVAGPEPGVPAEPAGPTPPKEKPAAKTVTPPVAEKSETPEAVRSKESMAPEPVAAGAEPAHNLLNKANPGLARLARSLQN